MSLSETITLVGASNEPHRFESLKEVVAFIERNPQVQFDCYCGQDVYEAIIQRVQDSRAKEEQRTLASNRAWRNNLSTWGDVDLLDDERDKSYERLVAISLALSDQLRYCGERSAGE